MLNRRIYGILFLIVALSAASPLQAAPRDVQIVEVDFENQIIELFNFGSTTENLSGWRFCSHDDTFIRRYSSSAGLNGVSIGAGESLLIHLLSDSGGAPGTLDRPAGAFADPFDPGAHGLQLYFAPVSFSNGATIADHVQWNVDGIDDAVADERSDEAQAGGVWTDQSTWVSTEGDSASIMLLEASNGLTLHGPSDYVAVPEPQFTAMLILGALGILATNTLHPTSPRRKAHDRK